MAYNPSNHIPLSKAMGANAFPVDGKYMYFTNGANGVYSYRPFQSAAEAISYFPLGSAFRGNSDGQPWAFEVLINSGGTLSVDGGSITGGVNEVWWWQNGVEDSDLVKKIGQGSSLIDKFIEITVSGSLIGAYELDISAETDIPQPTTKPFVTIKPFGSSNNDEAQSAYTYNQSTKTIVGLPQLNEGDVITVYMVGRANTTPPIIPNSVIVGMDFGSAENFQAYLLSKGNTGAVVTNYQFPYGEGGEGFTVSGISSLVANTFAASDISVFIAGDWLTGNVGSNCFSGCVNLTSFFAPNLSGIGLYCFDNCSALIELTIGNVQTINPGAFRNASGLSGETISLPTLLAPNGLGSSPADQGVFEGITGLTINNVPIAFQTNNSGTPDGDLQYVTTNGGTVTYV